ncbi:MAG TPA: hypothetical protein PKM27_06325 [Saprospiraceae bacterium]|nr:hypothetical protein [Saprospiraceae bacterium]HNT21856.1 hypothetical protein [Saprospiraceae bacterium]
MEKYHLDHDISILYVQASSFPEGISAAWESLHSRVKDSQGRKNFGISFMDRTGGIIYRAATEEAYPGEADQYGCETFKIKKGDYLSVLIPDFMENIPSIGQVFRKLTAESSIDPEGVAVEDYFNEKDVRCMVRLLDEPA